MATAEDIDRITEVRAALMGVPNEALPQRLTYQDTGHGYWGYCDHLDTGGSRIIQIDHVRDAAIGTMTVWLLKMKHDVHLDPDHSWTPMTILERLATMCRRVAGRNDMKKDT